MKTCRICNHQFASLAKAHLIPDSFKKITGEFGGSSNHLILANLDLPKTQKIQTLEFDKEIICPDCDKSLSSFDKAFKNFVEAWSNSELRQLDPQGSPHFVEFEADTSKLLSGVAVSLFRCSISKRCQTVNIGSKYESEMAKLLHDGSSAPIPSAFDLKLQGIAPHEQSLEMAMISPFKLKFGNCHIHFLFVYGSVFIAKFGKAAWPSEFHDIPSVVAGRSSVSLLVSELRHSYKGQLIGHLIATHRKQNP